MKYKTRFFYTMSILLVAVLVSCSQDPTQLPTQADQLTTPTLPDPPVTTTLVPDVFNTTSQYLEKWQDEEYIDMYSLLTSDSKNQISEDQFIQRHTDFAQELTLSGLDYELVNKQTHPDQGKVFYQVAYQSALFGDFFREMVMELVLEGDDWRIIWDDSLIMPELDGGNYLKMDPELTLRKGIFDNNEDPLAIQSEAVAVGLYPDYVYLEESGGLLSLLSQLTGRHAASIAKDIENAYPGQYLPIGEVDPEQYSRIISALSGYDYVSISRYDSRFYPEGGIAPHVVGYVSAIQEDEVVEFRQLGYQSYEKVGREGLEQWGEPNLSGTRGGTLYVLDPDGKIVNQLAHAPSSPGEDIYTNFDSEFQDLVQGAIEGFRGAIVVLEKDTGKVLAMASSPRYNPNAFQTENINWDSWLEKIYNDPNTPLFNRASQGQYPLGSVFKIITMAAALESDVYTPDTTYECGYFFEEAIGLDLHDWTYDWFLEDGITEPSGLLTLVQGLIRSCNPYFWHIGLDLYERGLTTAVSDMARGFGLGEPTGIVGIQEEAGNVPDPGEPGDAINLAIGQGDLLVTPLQVASFVAALGNGGTLHTPWVIDRIEDQNGNVTLELAVEESSILPVSTENLDVIQEAMKGVVFSRNPRGTAFNAFRGFDIPIAGKTGTAESSALDPHAWFVGYSLAGLEEKPDIAVVVIVENVGEGSEWAAPIFRRVMELYFYGVPQRLYPWEAIVGVTKTPTPLVTETPSP